MASVEQPSADEALARLGPLVGVWIVEAGPPGGPTQPLGEATVAWQGSFLVIDTHFPGPGGPPSGTMIIGCDAGNGTYTQLYSDDRGVCRTYAMTLDEKRWTLRRDGDPFPQRFTATVDADVMSGVWEKAPDGGRWEVDFELIYRRRRTLRGQGSTVRS